jgi:hypothetical protein
MYYIDGQKNKYSATINPKSQNHYISLYTTRQPFSESMSKQHTFSQAVSKSRLKQPVGRHISHQPANHPNLPLR